jgi:hypothetical protein
MTESVRERLARVEKQTAVHEAVVEEWRKHMRERMDEVLATLQTNQAETRNLFDVMKKDFCSKHSEQIAELDRTVATMADATGIRPGRRSVVVGATVGGGVFAVAQVIVLIIEMLMSRQPAGPARAGAGEHRGGSGAVSRMLTPGTS